MIDQVDIIEVYEVLYARYLLGIIAMLMRRRKSFAGLKP
jgi:hypothetical protein